MYIYLRSRGATPLWDAWRAAAAPFQHPAGAIYMYIYIYVYIYMYIYIYTACANWSLEFVCCLEFFCFWFFVCCLFHLIPAMVRGVVKGRVADTFRIGSVDIGSFVQHLFHCLFTRKQTHKQTHKQTDTRMSPTPLLTQVSAQTLRFRVHMYVCLCANACMHT